MAFHVACPITCRRICFCSLGFPRDLHSRKPKADFLFDVAGIDEFLTDPLGIRASREGTVLVSVPKVVPVPVPVPASIPPTHSLEVVSARDREGDGGVGEDAFSTQTKRVAIQRQAAAAKASAEYYAKKVESGDTVASKDTPGEDADPFCQICFVGQTRGSERARKMLPCKSCGKKYHRSCLKTWARHRDLFHWSSWTCPSCRTCEVCRKTGDPSKFVFCRRCDGAYHCYCQHPPHKNVSSGPYLCPKHTRCHSCGSSVPGNGLSVRWFLGYTCCDACGRLFVKGNYCPVCLKVYRDSESTPMVCCDICQRWVHCHCDGISDEKYLQFQADGNLQYQCATCRGECYQVKDLKDAIQELWRRRDKADRGLIASLRAAAGLPAEEDICSISPYSDGDGNGPEALRNDFGYSINLSLKGIGGKSPKKSKDHGKKHWNKKYPKKKSCHAASISKSEPHQHDIHSYVHDMDDCKNYDSESQAKGGSDKSCSLVAGIVNHTEGVCSISQPGGLKHKFVDEVMVSDGERTSNVFKIKSNKPHDVDSWDDTEKHAGKSKSVKAKRLVINLGARKINVSSPPKSDVQSCQSELDLKVSNRDTVDHSGQTRGLIKFARREGNLIKFGKVKAEASNFNPKSDGGSHSDGYETVPLDHARVSSAKKSLEGSRAVVRPAGGEVPTLRSDKLSLGKQSEVRPDTHTESNGDSGDTPIFHSLPKESKLSLKLKIKKPNLENQSSLIHLHEEEKSNIRGQRSKRKRALSLMEKTMYNEDEGMPPSHLDSEMTEADWILKKLGKDAIGKRVEVHQPSDNSWHKGVVSDIVEGTSMLSVALDDGIVKTLKLGKQAVRIVSQKQKRSKT
ncbi:hypothetical protein NC652_023160 [Populus alba x Populus x berolinensis]|uniref:uncharacterized protein isoform X1 n=1 Tax=Populus alba TaxID=43335 RepID=UPI00158D2073|nr:uncharacterized protein LOC118027711 isoform X1 [Populus alba]KAJ6905317.1 hypothetical protein NC652_023160 [Populus alba x Populus x berolinensis]